MLSHRTKGGMLSHKLGCLGQILGLFLKRERASPNVGDLPYRVRDDFISPAERSFLGVLQLAVDGRAVICPKVNLHDLFFVPKNTPDFRSHRNRIDRKHVDFLLCDPNTMRPLAGIELDDSSHERQDRQQRDRFVESVFSAADLPLVRFAAKQSYNPAEVEAQLRQLFVPRPIAMPPSFRGQTPICPKCRVTMMRRLARRGNQKGEGFWGCVNFPRCTEKLVAN